MNLSLFDNIKTSTIIKIVFFFVLLLILPLFTSYYFIKQSYIGLVEKSLKNTIGDIKKDLILKNGNWDLTLYNADPSTPSPSSSNPFPLYIVTTEGFVIERSRPINGLLDSADFKRLLEFKEPTTITTPTNETWRIFSKPINYNNRIIGVATVAHYYSSANSNDEIDKELSLSLDNILSKTKKDNLSVSLKLSDLKDIPYDISYEVVNNLNRIVVTYGRIPSFMDVSYVSSQLSAGERYVDDSVTKERYLVISQVLSDKKGLPIGVIVTGRSINNITIILHNYLLFSLLTRLLLTIPFSIIAVYLLRKEISELLNAENKKSIFRKISFNKKSGIVEVDKKKIQIPYASNQYYLCKAVFSDPKKKMGNG